MSKICYKINCNNESIPRGKYCFTHKTGKRCSEINCTSSARDKTDKCKKHGGGKRCPNCISHIDSRVGCKKYDDYCATCFKQLFPDDKRSEIIRINSPEMKVRNFLSLTYEGFIHNKPIYSGNCDFSHIRRIDHRKLIGNTLIAIETDENQHKYYNKEDEEIRYDDVYMVHSGKWIFIRFNPDSYVDKKGKKQNTLLKRRLEVFKKEIDKQILRVENEENNELVEIIF